MAHDLNNQFNAALALSATLGFAVKNESDRAAIAELEQGTKVGMRMIRSLARLLVRREAVREPGEPAGDSGDEAAIVGRKRGREDDEGESGERNRLVAGRLVGGPGDERCRQAAAAAVRRHRGGGGKRGWLA